MGLDFGIQKNKIRRYVMAESGTDLGKYYGQASSTISWQNTTTGNFDTPHFSGRIKMTRDSEKGKIHPRLYFKYLKSKLSPMETHRLKKRMRKLEEMVDEYAQVGQEALSDECLKQYIVISRESAIMACGIKIFVSQENVNKFRYDLKNATLKITPLKNFARLLPKRVATKTKKCIEKNLFDDYVVFHLDDKSALDTAKEKEEKRRDPILFGKIQYSDKHYFIADWEDEYDSLTLDKIIKKLSLKKRNMTLKSVPEIKKI